MNKQEQEELMRLVEQLPAPKSAWKLGTIANTHLYVLYHLPLFALVYSAAIRDFLSVFLILPGLIIASSVQALGYLFISHRLGVRTLRIVMTGSSVALLQPLIELQSFRTRLRIALAGPIASLLASLLFISIPTVLEWLFPQIITHSMYREFDWVFMVFAGCHFVAFFCSFFPVFGRNGIRIVSLFVLANATKQRDYIRIVQISLRTFFGLMAFGALFMNTDFAFFLFCLFLSVAIYFRREEMNESIETLL